MNLVTEPNHSVTSGIISLVVSLEANTASRYFPTVTITHTYRVLYSLQSALESQRAFYIHYHNVTFNLLIKTPFSN